ncbi:MAG TPA: 2-amino-4-hydroxy-6-hydroxymethyldihydropteridine diphosphokinase [Anaeromyxobacter sp.]|nr:2-amino-4-hydroxy-6-hydroxymethyldihydropteridine diphosphokinase [Anaeromyxobacter sp.]
MRAYVGVGTNLGDRWANLAHAARAFRAEPRIAVLRASHVYDTAPLGPPQPRYLNAVLELEAELPAPKLLEVLQRIERSRGRRRTGVRWTARTLDLDLLLAGDAVIRGPDLAVPHPGLASRRFVLQPLAELCPDQVVPGTGHTVAQLLAEAPEGDVEAVGIYPL